MRLTFVTLFWISLSDDCNGECSIGRIEEKLKTSEFSKEFSQTPQYFGSFHESQREINAVKNRYTDILPYDSTRVILSSKPDYINANHVVMKTEIDETRKWIATQGSCKNYFV